MAESAIVVDGVSKRFRLYHERNRTLKSAVLRGGRARYEEFWALRDVSLEIEAGKTFGLIGENGSGKSTLLKCIAKILRPEKGRIRTQGKMAALLELGSGFHPELSGRENTYLNGAILGLSRQQIDERIDQIIDFSGLAEFIDSPVKIYSSGMYVRLGFSVAVHVDPDILIIDEVIAVGDEDFQRRCFDHLYKLRRQGVTIVVVSHSLGLMQTLCDEVSWLDHGRLLESGPAPDVVRSYLEQVNTVEAERIVTDDAKRMAALANTPQLDLDDGQKPITIESVEFVDERGEHLAVAATGRPLTVRVHYDAHRPVDRPNFSFAVEDMAGVHLANPGVRTGDRTPDLVLEGRGYVDYAVDRLALGPGEYDLSVAIHDAHGMVRLDYQARTVVLHVQPGDEPIMGKIDMLGTWATPRGAGSVAP